MQLVLIRATGTPWHPGAPTTDECRIQGTISLPLSEQGKADLRHVADELRRLDARAILSSGNESSGATADYLAQYCSLKHRKLPELRELDYGMWQGLRIAEIRERFHGGYKQWLQDPTLIKPPQGESLDQALERVKPALAQIRRKYRGKTVVLVAAHVVAGLIECYLTGLELRKLWQVACRPENFRILKVEDTDGVEASARLIHQAIIATHMGAIEPDCESGPDPAGAPAPEDHPEVLDQDRPLEDDPNA